VDEQHPRRLLGDDTVLILVDILSDYLGTSYSFAVQCTEVGLPARVDYVFCRHGIKSRSNSTTRCMSMLHKKSK